MILDELNEIADNVSVTGGAGTVQLGDNIGRAGGISASCGLFLVVQVSEAIVGASAGTLALSLVSDAQGAIATDGSATRHATGRAWVTGASAIPAGTVLLCVEIPPGQYEDYLGLLLTRTGGDITAGKVNAFLTPDAAKWVAVADGV